MPRDVRRLRRAARRRGARRRDRRRPDPPVGIHTPREERGCRPHAPRRTFTGSMSQRDDFSEPVKRALAARVGNLCSNPDCRALTSGPHEDAARAVNLGVAAHITAAAPGGPRYDATLTPEQRAAIENAIWLCQTCAKLIDNDPVRFPVTLLLDWKSTAEAEARTRLGKAAVPPKADEAPLEGILEPGTATLPKFAGPAALLNARHEIVPFHVGAPTSWRWSCAPGARGMEWPRPDSSTGRAGWARPGWSSSSAGGCGGRAGERGSCPRGWNQCASPSWSRVRGPRLR